MAKTEVCKWKYDIDYGFWETGCGEAFTFTTGTPAENKMKYCPYCGKKLVPVKVKGGK